MRHPYGTGQIGVSISKREKCTLSRTGYATDFYRWPPRRMKVQGLAVWKRFPLVKSSMASVFSKALIQLSRLTYHLRVQKAGLDMLTPYSASSRLLSKQAQIASGRRRHPLLLTSHEIPEIHASRAFGNGIDDVIQPLERTLFVAINQRF
jgi:hypothetical protein